MNGELFALMFILGGVAGLFLMIMPFRNHNLAKPGTFKVKKHLYTYEIGDMLLRFEGQNVYSGMDVHTNKRLPHIFVNAYPADEGVSVDSFMVPGDERVHFKHDINKHLEVYTADPFDHVVHKIFTPDILDALVKAKYRYNIEIVDRHIRLIVPTNVPVVGPNPDMQHDILKVAKQLTEQVDQVLEKWDESHLEQATKRD